MRTVLERLSSVRLAIALLILLASASALGTLVPQGRSPEEYRARYGAAGDVVTGLRLDRLYGSPAYLALLLLFGANLATCGLARFLPRLRRACGQDPRADAEAMGSLSVGESFVRRGGLENAVAAARRELARRRYRVREASEPGRHFLLARRRGLGAFGPDVVHLGLLVILAGGFVSGFGRSKAFLSLTEGGTASLGDGRPELRLDRFETEYHPRGGVKDWRSVVTVLENGVPLVTRAIEVNHPLKWRGVRYYQSGYGRDWESAAVVLRAGPRADPGASRDLGLAPGKSADLGDGTTLSLVRFVPDFIIGEGGAVSSRSSEPNNPAVLVEGSRSGRSVFSGWIFARYPEVSRLRPEGATDLVLELRSFDAPKVSILQATRDPGAPAIWLGSALLLAGLFLGFYWLPREVRMSFSSPDGNSVSIAAGGMAKKGRESFEKEFSGVLAALRKAS